MKKLSSGDTIIRDQFRSFLRAIGFHKGIYFLTADKSNAALARAEGLSAIYYKTPSWQVAKKVIKSPEISAKPETLKLGVPISKLMHELAVQFGSIKVRWDNEEIEMACDAVGESLAHWTCRELRFNDRHPKKLLEIYSSAGKFALSDVVKTYNEVNN